MSNEFKIWILCAAILMLMLVLSGCTNNELTDSGLCNGIEKSVDKVNETMINTTNEEGVAASVGDLMARIDAACGWL